jgi:hypothetical protein
MKRPYALAVASAMAIAGFGQAPRPAERRHGLWGVYDRAFRGARYIASRTR